VDIQFRLFHPMPFQPFLHGTHSVAGHSPQDVVHKSWRISLIWRNFLHRIVFTYGGIVMVAMLLTFGVTNFAGCADKTWGSYFCWKIIKISHWSLLCPLFFIFGNCTPHFPSSSIFFLIAHLVLCITAAEEHEVSHCLTCWLLKFLYSMMEDSEWFI